jgi:hypothetical protein
MPIVWSSPLLGGETKREKARDRINANSERSAVHMSAWRDRVTISIVGHRSEITEARSRSSCGFPSVQPVKSRA